MTNESNLDIKHIEEYVNGEKVKDYYNIFLNEWTVNISPEDLKELVEKAQEFIKREQESL